MVVVTAVAVVAVELAVEFPFVVAVVVAVELAVEFPLVVAVVVAVVLLVEFAALVVVVFAAFVVVVVAVVVVVFATMLKNVSQFFRTVQSIQFKLGNKLHLHSRQFFLG